ncbi:MAG: hypothetical protein JXA95_09645 [Spirochaetales bacterium]|nr:hypothetical protein [Spirochaetales bacterium]
MMKKFVLAAVVSLLALSLYAGDTAEMWSRVYLRSTSLDQKTTAMEKMVQLDDPALEITMTLALDELINGALATQAVGPNSYVWENLVRMVMNELAQYQAVDSAYLINQVVEERSGIIKADAIMALGDMRAMVYAPGIATMLRNLNMNSSGNKSASELIAYSSVYALGKMKAVEGFSPVFYAQVGWYTRRTRLMAEKVLSEMLEDPSDEFLKIIKDADYKNKLIALNGELQSTAPAEGKEKVVIEALKQGIETFSSDPTELSDLYQLRIAALTACYQLGISNGDTLGYFLKAYKDADKLEEKILVVQAVGTNGSDEAVKMMGEWLNDFHERMLSHLNPSNDEITLITQLIYGLELSGNPLAKPLLSEIEVYGYSNKINRAAAAALKKME